MLGKEGNITTQECKNRTSAHRRSFNEKIIHKLTQSIHELMHGGDVLNHLLARRFKVSVRFLHKDREGRTKYIEKRMTHYLGSNGYKLKFQFQDIYAKLLLSLQSL